MGMIPVVIRFELDGDALAGMLALRVWELTKYEAAQSEDRPLVPKARALAVVRSQLRLRGYEQRYLWTGCYEDAEVLARLRWAARMMAEHWPDMKHRLAAEIDALTNGKGSDRMKTMTIMMGGHVFRWNGGTFVPVWTAGRADEHVPDDMIQLPLSLNRSKAGREDIQRLAADYLKTVEDAGVDNPRQTA
jgi:hypothetical protein